MNIVCGFLDHLLYYFPELKHLNTSHRLLYHACSDKILSTVTHSHVHAYVIINDIIIQNWTLPDNSVIELMYM